MNLSLSNLHNKEGKDISILGKQFFLLLFGLIFHCLIFSNIPTFWQSSLYSSFIQIALSIYGLLMIANVLANWRHKIRIATYFAVISTAIFLPAYLHLVFIDIPHTLIGVCVMVFQGYSVSRLLFNRFKSIDYFSNTTIIAEEVQTSYRRVDDLFFMLLLTSCGLCYLSLKFSILHTPLTSFWIPLYGFFLILSTLYCLYIEHVRLEAFSLKKIWYPRFLILIIPLFLLYHSYNTTRSIASYIEIIAILFVFRILYINWLLWLKNKGFQKFWAYFVMRPAVLLTTSFIILICIGTLLLNLPMMMHPDAEPLSFVNCLFMVTSATCVTGLGVCNIADSLSFWGQLVILILAQIGGLGLMTISIFIAMLLQKDIGLRSSFSIGEMIGEQHCRTAQNLLKTIIFTTLIIELIGAIVLCICYIHFEKIPLLKAIYYSAFHTVTAFCNTGFSVHPQGLVGIHPSIGLTISVLIILGGLGFSFYYTLLPLLKKQKIRFNQHTKVVSYCSIFLTFFGMLIILLSFTHCPLPDTNFFMHTYHAWFQSVTARTAGFNTIDLTLLHPLIWIFISCLMFIGGAPGSTAGGIKVTTFWVLISTVKSYLKGESDIIIFQRKVESRTLVSAISLLLVSSIALLILFCLVCIYGFTPEFVQGCKDFYIKTMFVCVSAFGTTGLDLDLCPHLTNMGQLLICMLMFIGRLGPLTLLILLRTTNQKTSLRYPTDNIMIG